MPNLASHLKNNLNYMKQRKNLLKTSLKTVQSFIKCLNQHDRHKLKRKKYNESTENDFASLKTRRSEQAGNFSASCFFCEDAGGSLHECQTQHLVNQVHKIAEALCNTNCSQNLVKVI